MTAEERAALIDRLAPLIIEERRKAAEQNPMRPPWYMTNIAHPVMGWLYNQYLAKLGEVSPPGDACRTRFELSLLHPAVLKQLAEALQDPITPPRRGRYAAKAARGRGGP